MSTTMFFLLFIPLLALILLAINLIFAPHNPYQEKDSSFECGFSSFLTQNRTQFNISFYIFGLLFLLFDLEILLVYPYVVSAYTNGIYGLVIMLLFFLLLTLGFAFELGKNALKIDSRQVSTLANYNSTVIKSISVSSSFNVILYNFFIRLISTPILRIMIEQYIFKNGKNTIFTLYTCYLNKLNSISLSILMLNIYNSIINFIGKNGVYMVYMYITCLIINHTFDISLVLCLINILLVFSFSFLAIIYINYINLNIKNNHKLFYYLLNACLFTLFLTSLILLIFLILFKINKIIIKFVVYMMNRQNGNNSANNGNNNPSGGGNNGGNNSNNEGNLSSQHNTREDDDTDANQGNQGASPVNLPRIRELDTHPEVIIRHENFRTELARLQREEEFSIRQERQQRWLERERLRLENNKDLRKN